MLLTTKKLRNSLCLAMILIVYPASNLVAGNNSLSVSKVFQSPLKGYILLHVLNKQTVAIDEVNININHIDKVVKTSEAETVVYASGLSFAIPEYKFKHDDLVKLLNKIKSE